MQLLYHLTLPIKMVMVPLYAHLLRGGSVLAALEAAEEAQGDYLFWCKCSTKL